MASGALRLCLAVPHKAGLSLPVEDSIYLAPDARGRGVGGALLAELIRPLRKSARASVLQMVAVIRAAAHPAVDARFHQKAGFSSGRDDSGDRPQARKLISTNRPSMQRSAPRGQRATDPSIRIPIRERCFAARFGRLSRDKIIYRTSPAAAFRNNLSTISSFKWPRLRTRPVPEMMAKAPCLRALEGSFSMR